MTGTGRTTKIFQKEGVTYPAGSEVEIVADDHYIGKMQIRFEDGRILGVNRRTVIRDFS